MAQDDKHERDQVEGVELIGVGLDARPPLKSTYLRLDPGLTILYGVNGAGKTRILDGLCSALAPRSSQERSSRGCAVYVHFDGADGVFKSALVAGAKERYADYLFRNTVDDFPDWTEPWTEDVDVRVVVRDVVEAELRHRFPGIGEEVARQGLFTISGDVVCIAARLGPETPALQQLWDNNVAYMRQLINWRDSREVQAEHTLARIVGQPPPDSPELTLRGALEAGFGNAPPPPWVPETLFPIARLSTDVATLLEEHSGDLNKATLECLRSAGMPSRHPPVLRNLAAGLDDRAVTNPAAEELAAKLSASATELVGLMLLDAPVLRCEIRPPEEWPERPAILWTAYDTPSMQWVPVTDTSKAQKRWSQLAIRGAFADVAKVRLDAVVIDEPEEALHARAERHLAGGLERLAERADVPVIVATHSAELLRARDATLHHVTRDDRGHVSIRSMPSEIRDNLDDLGLDVADILQLVRVFVLVEGQHDKVVVENLLVEQLDTARAVVVPIRGVVQLAPTVDSQLIFDFTSASVLIVLDNVGQRATKVWDEVAALAAAGDGDAARAALERGFSGKRSHEERFLKEFGRRAVDARRLERISVFSFEKSDIVAYLPVEHLVPGAVSWDALYKEHQERGSGDFKLWASSERGASFSDDRIEAAARSIADVPDEFVQLAATLLGTAPTPPSIDRL